MNLCGRSRHLSFSFCVCFCCGWSLNHVQLSAQAGGMANIIFRTIFQVFSRFCGFLLHLLHMRLPPYLCWSTTSAKTYIANAPRCQVWRFNSHRKHNRETVLNSSLQKRALLIHLLISNCFPSSRLSYLLRCAVLRYHFKSTGKANHHCET